jgi:hypothetical protein
LWFPQYSYTDNLLQGCLLSQSSRMTNLHGFPIAIEFLGILLETTLFAPITEFSPIVTPFRIRQL